MQKHVFFPICGTDNVRLFIVTGGNPRFIACKVQNRRDTSKRQTFGSELSLSGRAPAAVGADCWYGYLSSDAGDKRHLPPLLPTVHRVASSSVLSALSHQGRLVSAGKWNGRTGTKDVCVRR